MSTTPNAPPSMVSGFAAVAATAFGVSSLGAGVGSCCRPSAVRHRDVRTTPVMKARDRAWPDGPCAEHDTARRPA
ncbi:hypothetical protein [Nocardia callitridis]|uniref:hypothetical protein n=1 Tax=Nocardia callitridis TaxID=648753 RepID=UPI0031ECA725